MKISAVKVEKINPKMMVLAMGPQTTDLPPKPRAVGRSPEMVVILVRRMGRSRVTAASFTARPRAMPFSLSSLMKLIRTMESLTAIPARATPA